MTTKVGFFQCTNAAPIICYPQILNPSNPDQPLWDGRKVSGFQYELLVNQSVIVNLKVTGISAGSRFLIGEDTVAGVDRYASSPEFEYDPNSTNMCCGTRWGAIYNGSFTWDGNKDSGSPPSFMQIPQSAQIADLHNLAASYVHEAMREFGRPDDSVAGESFDAAQVLPETRVVEWKDGSDLKTINAGIASIVGRLIIQGYNYDYETLTEEGGKATTTFFFGPKVDPALKLVTDWKAALIKATVSASAKEGALLKSFADLKVNSAEAVEGEVKDSTPPKAISPV
ncbi:hypothetical protein M422DRAFT_261442 [Sphaerobolus stellatus SS14]|uniref:Uncharacterized protein n=1 Tax=Sphaerobolus stellatus (strain SS14) TaxID=990650 RepID=A0A0C9VEQ8_SPHS4|nr:hypothetical protein M422DRAFT_261442 [Sphaerobolus stellatus SS14]